MIHFNFRFNTGTTILMVIILCFALPVRAQTNTGGSEPQFLFPGFTQGKISMKSGQSQSVKLNYNIVSEKMVYEKDGNLFDMINNSLIDTVYLQTRKFIPVGNIFHEVLLSAPISLFMQHKGVLIPQGTPAGYGSTSQTSSTDIISSLSLPGGNYNLKLPSNVDIRVDLIYWIRKDNSMYSFINERQFLKIFPGKETEFKQFIKQNKIKLDKLPDLIRLVQHCNESFR
jgi:hypothetical protein